MKRLAPGLPSPAMLIALLALFVALGTGAYAAKKVGTGEIQKGAVTSKKLHVKAVKAKHIAKKAVKESKIADEAVSEGTIADDAVTTPKLAHPTYWALVDGSTQPSIVNGEGVTAVERPAGGNPFLYLLAFEEPVDKCALLATPEANQSGTAYRAEALAGIPVPEAVIVRITDQRGIDASRNFSLAVHC